ncbi:MAG: hypothetical protein KC736_02745 [Candidatus Moranbacteria bacterium]|nr:hypothetical protein [Candidatus Moranbacteria bacterium]
MTVRTYTIGLLLCAVLVFAAGIAGIITINPTTAGVGEYVFVYGVFLTGFSCLFSAIMVSINTRGISQSDREEMATHVRIACRQGFLLGLMCVLLALMQQYRLLIWWSGLLLVVAVCLVELWILWKQSK